MTLIARNSLSAVDPVTVDEFTKQFIHVEKALENQLINEENFSSNSHRKIRTISDAVNSSRYYDGIYICRNTEVLGSEPALDLKVAVDSMADKSLYDYIVVGQYFEFSLSVDGAKMVSNPSIDTERALSGLATIAGFTATGATVGVTAGLGIASIPGAVVGAGAGLALGLATVVPTWFSKRPKTREKGQKLNESDMIRIEVPFGFTYYDHAVSGTITSSLGEGDRVKPLVFKTGSDTDSLFFQVTSENKGSFTSTEFYVFHGYIQVLLRRKL